MHELDELCKRANILWCTHSLSVLAIIKIHVHFSYICILTYNITHCSGEWSLWHRPFSRLRFDNCCKFRSVLQSHLNYGIEQYMVQFPLWWTLYYSWWLHCCDRVWLVHLYLVVKPGYSMYTAVFITIRLIGVFFRICFFFSVFLLLSVFTVCFQHCVDCVYSFQINILLI